MLNEYSELFLGQLGSVKVAKYEIKLADQVPVQSPPYHCTLPKLKLLKEYVEDLLQKGVVRSSKPLMLARRFYYLIQEAGIGWW